MPTGGGGGGRQTHTRKHGLSQLQRFLWAEGEQESGNNYLAVNPGSGALGRWQVMPSNLPAWLPESGQPQMSGDAFLHNHNAQNAVALHILGGYFRTYGPAGAAAMWYSGQPDPTKTYGDPPVYQYVADVLRLMGDPKAGSITSTGQSFLLPWSVPKPDRTDSWAQYIHESAVSLHNMAGSARQYANLVSSTYHR